MFKKKNLSFFFNFFWGGGVELLKLDTRGSVYEMDRQTKCKKNRWGFTEMERQSKCQKRKYHWNGWHFIKKKFNKWINVFLNLIKKIQLFSDCQSIS